MNFEEFKSLALNPQYLHDNVVYRVDLHYIVEPGKNDLEFSVSKRHSFLYPDLKTVEFMLKRFVGKEMFNKDLFAIYVYELPFNKDVENNLYQRLWVYDNRGDLISQSVCSALVEDIDQSCAKFRGRSPRQIFFQPGDIVEIYDHYNKTVQAGIVVESPLTIEQCWKIRERIKEECIKEGIPAEEVDYNYYLYITDDSYLVADIDNQTTVRTTNVFPVSVPVPDKIRERLITSSRSAQKRLTDNNQNKRMSESTALKRLQSFINLLNSL
ncbi:MAG: hypothetical protein J1E97_04110 [Muribaculaceae bacterium]|nr:hypothetical protein [Muribaculaceae bacterium]